MLNLLVDMRNISTYFKSHHTSYRVIMFALIYFKLHVPLISCVPYGLLILGGGFPHRNHYTVEQLTHL